MYGSVNYSLHPGVRGSTYGVCHMADIREVAACHRRTGELQLSLVPQPHVYIQTQLPLSMPSKDFPPVLGARTPLLSLRQRGANGPRQKIKHVEFWRKGSLALDGRRTGMKVEVLCLREQRGGKRGCKAAFGHHSVSLPDVPLAKVLPLSCQCFGHLHITINSHLHIPWYSLLLALAVLYRTVLILASTHVRHPMTTDSSIRAPPPPHYPNPGWMFPIWDLHCVIRPFSREWEPDFPNHVQCVCWRIRAGRIDPYVCIMYVGILVCTMYVHAYLYVMTLKLTYFKGRVLGHFKGNLVLGDHVLWDNLQLQFNKK